MFQSPLVSRGQGGRWSRKYVSFDERVDDFDQDFVGTSIETEE